MFHVFSYEHLWIFEIHFVSVKAFKKMFLSFTTTMTTKDSSNMRTKVHTYIQLTRKSFEKIEKEVHA